MLDLLHASHRAARKFEEALPKERRKQLGQFFTGTRLSRLLVELALAPDTHSVLDPMAGHGDLLDAAAEAFPSRGVKLDRLHGVEIEPETALFCRDRLLATRALGAGAPSLILCGDAFSPKVISRLGQQQYDLVITNPPYVRYQTTAGAGGRADSIREGLLAISDHIPCSADKFAFETLVRGYSGLADLSVPAWLLAGALVRPNGRLALVAPATWRSRDYADVIRYFLLRFFHLEYVIEDTQPGWFSDALVRTHLIVARRLPTDQAIVPVGERPAAPSATWLRISPNAATEESLVGAAFRGARPEAAFSRWASRIPLQRRTGIEVNQFNVQDEWNALAEKARQRPWFASLELRHKHEDPLFAEKTNKSYLNSLPEPITRILRDRITKTQSLLEAGIHVGQGLRTGCNDFFYVDVCGAPHSDPVQIVTSSAFGSRRFSVPAATLRPVLRRQNELNLIELGKIPSGRVLDLRNWILPEDAVQFRNSKLFHRTTGKEFPVIMPVALAEYVRYAAKTPTQDGKIVPNMSAVRTNVRAARNSESVQRFWYMLPDFAPRHTPTSFIPRVINDEIRAQRNLSAPILVDANFSTLWSDEKLWTPAAVKSLLSSAWCQLYMESIGTPLGGGALKLEASHIRQVRIPYLTVAQLKRLSKIGQDLGRISSSSRREIDALIFEALLGAITASDQKTLVQRFTAAATQLRRARRRSLV